MNTLLEEKRELLRRLKAAESDLKIAKADANKFYQIKGLLIRSRGSISLTAQAVLEIDKILYS